MTDKRPILRPAFTKPVLSDEARKEARQATLNAMRDEAKDG